MFSFSFPQTWRGLVSTVQIKTNCQGDGETRRNEPGSLHETWASALVEQDHEAGPGLLTLDSWSDYILECLYCSSLVCTLTHKSTVILYVFLVNISRETWLWKWNSNIWYYLQENQMPPQPRNFLFFHSLEISFSQCLAVIRPRDTGTSLKCTRDQSRHLNANLLIYWEK